MAQSLCGLLRNTGRWEEAVEEYRKALALPQKLDPKLAARPGFRHRLGQDHSDLGRLYRDRNRDDEAETEFRKSIELLAPLAEAFPKVTPYRRSLASAPL